MLAMALQIVGENQDIIDIGRAEIVEIAHQGLVDKSLECRRPVCQPERQYLELVRAVTATESGKLLGVRMHPNSVECLSNIDLGEILGLRDAGKGLFNQREGVSVLPSDGV